jgi:hypothetical protein
MESFLSLICDYWLGVILFFASLFLLMIIFTWLAWLFSWGRFGQVDLARPFKAIRYVIGDLLVEIIYEFRHLLALIIAMIFALALVYAMIHASATNGNMSDAIQGVVASLGGLIGSIIGYYFGESAASKAAARDDEEVFADDSGRAEQDPWETDHKIEEVTSRVKKDNSNNNTTP